MMQNNEAMHPGSLFTNGARAREQGREWVWGSESGREMPHVEQWDLLLFPSNIHKQEQTKSAAQSESFLINVTEHVSFLVSQSHGSAANHYLAVYINNTPQVY